MKPWKKRIGGTGLAALAFLAHAQTPDQGGRLIDATTGKAVPDGIVTTDGREQRLSDQGIFQLRGQPAHIAFRAPGYRQMRMTGAELRRAGGEVRMTPFTPHALYLTGYGVASKKLMGEAMALFQKGRANAIVFDLKGDRGQLSYRSKVALVASVGADRAVTIPDLSAFVQRLHAHRLYVIGRIVTFKDDPLVRARPDLAVRLGSQAFRDREGLGWTDPFEPAVRKYNIDIAVEAAKAGIDEIQFDYLRFPDSSARLTFTEPSNQTSRAQAIAGFLADAREKLVPYNVFLAADIFGYVCWNTNDTGIGQQLELMAAQVDYLSPMLYPSGYTWGIPGVRNPVANPYAIVRNSLTEARRRLGISPKRFRPWLQAFKDYAFDRRAFDKDEVIAQIRAARDFGSDGWMLWNARNIYAQACPAADEL